LYLEFDVLKMSSHFFSVPHSGKVAGSGKISARTDHDEGREDEEEKKNEENSSCQSDAPWLESSIDR